jgi:hypothetical protein
VSLIVDDARLDEKYNVNLARADSGRLIDRIAILEHDHHNVISNMSLALKLIGANTGADASRDKICRVSDMSRFVLLQLFRVGSTYLLLI